MEYILGTGFFPQDYDSDALAYFAAAGIVNPSEKIAANNLISGMKSAGLWQIMDRLYLFSPTSAGAALYDVKTLTQMTNVNGVTFSSRGLTTDGATQYLDTSYIPSSSGTMTTSSAHLCTYVNGTYQFALSGQGFLMGCGSNPNSADGALFIYGVQGTPFIFSIGLFTALADQAINNDGNGLGLILGNRPNNANIEAWVNGIQTGAHLSDSAALSTFSMAISDANLGGTYNSFLAGQTFAFASLGQSIPSSKQSTYYQLILNYQTALGRV